MMDIADRHGVKLTMFLDYCEAHLYAEALLDVGREIDRRGHDLQLHAHLDFLAKEFWLANGVTPQLNLNLVGPEQATAVFDLVCERHALAVGKPANAFRGGGYRYNASVLDALVARGVGFDFSVNVSRKTQPLDLQISKQSAWSNGCIEAAMSWMLMPNLHIVTFGDTDPRHMVQGQIIANLYEHEGLRHIVSDGSLGSPPPDGVKAFVESGYAFARLHAPDADCVLAAASYLAQNAAFHSRTHKHADHLSFVWYDRGRKILIDPGRYAYAGRTAPGSDLAKAGFWYSDPKRIYVESTRAHNTVEIDGRNFERTGAPWGSALLMAEAQGGLALTDCSATHFRTMRHRRHLIMRPGHFLIVLDWLFDRTEASHSLRQWFHFAPDWEVGADAGLVRARHPGGPALEPLSLTAAPLIPEMSTGAVVRGQEEPHLQGWWFDKPYSLQPTSCVPFEHDGSGPAILGAVFAFGEALVIDPATRFNLSMKNGRIRWRDERGANTVEIAHDEADRLKVIHKLK